MTEVIRKPLGTKALFMILTVVMISWGWIDQSTGWSITTYQIIFFKHVRSSICQFHQ